MNNKEPKDNPGKSQIQRNLNLKLQINKTTTNLNLPAVARISNIQNSFKQGSKKEKNAGNESGCIIEMVKNNLNSEIASLFKNPKKVLIREV